MFFHNETHCLQTDQKYNIKAKKKTMNNTLISKIHMSSKLYSNPNCSSHKRCFCQHYTPQVVDVLCPELQVNKHNGKLAKDAKTDILSLIAGVGLRDSLTCNVQLQSQKQRRRQLSMFFLCHSLSRNYFADKSVNIISKRT